MTTTPASPSDAAVVQELERFKAWLSTHDPRQFTPEAYSDQSSKWKAWQAALSKREVDVATCGIGAGNRHCVLPSGHDGKCNSEVDAGGEYMCPNCNTPWKCNGPHIEPPAVEGDGDWPEDFSHENGNYNNTCCHCQRIFVGHKRRITCKRCATPPGEAVIVELIKDDVWAMRMAAELTAAGYDMMLSSIHIVNESDGK